MLGLHSFLKQKRPGPKLRELVGARDCRIAASLRVEWTCWWLEWVAWRWLRGMPPRGSCHVSLRGGTANTSIQHTHFSRCRGGAGPWRAWPALLINSLKEPVHWLKKELMPAPCALPLPPSLRRPRGASAYTTRARRRIHGGGGRRESLPGRPRRPSHRPRPTPRARGCPTRAPSVAAGTR